MNGISWKQALCASRNVRGAELGADAYATVRPRGITGLFRARAPLTVILWAAAREGRLVWQDENRFALLEPPRYDKARRKPPELVLRWAAFADRHWENLLGAVIPGFLFLGALLVAVAGRRSSGAVLVALLLLLVGLSFTALLLTMQIVRSGAAFVRDFSTARKGEELLAADAPFDYWVVSLIHHTGEGRPGALIRLTTRRFDRLVSTAARSWAEDNYGVRVRIRSVVDTLGYLIDGATTEPMRARLRTEVAAVSKESADPKIVFAAGYDSGRKRLHRIVDAGGFLPIYLAGTALCIIVIAQMVAPAEAAACGHACAGRPATFGRALEWLGERLILREPAGISPGTSLGRVLGLLVSLLGLMCPLVAFVAVRRNREWRSAQIKAAREDKIRVESNTEVLLMVATDTEHAAVRAAAEKVTARPALPVKMGRHTVYDLGVISGANVRLARSGMGTDGQRGSALTARSLIDGLGPDYLLLVGIGCGLQVADESPSDDEGPRSSARQSMGDIMVSTQIRVMSLTKVVDSTVPGAPPITLLRGPRPEASPTLIDSAETAAVDWQGPDVHFGCVLSLNTLLNSRTERDHVLSLEPEAIGYEMEATGIYSAAALERVDWIVIKGISDKGYDKTDAHRQSAAEAAADFAVRMLDLGLLDSPP